MTKPHINHHHHPMQGCEVNHDALVNDVSTLTDPHTGLLQRYKGIKYRIRGEIIYFINEKDHTLPQEIKPEESIIPELYISCVINSLPDSIFLSVFQTYDFGATSR